ncbi:MAG: O-acetyl-ADP-ribose deacetylase [Acidobacteria bacterium]|jgi:O-acetyl-ADP-ribose deacetylase (regulator of RNase III)|nr:MAG: O-acetyl-ADP-ribose deacetylase [Acidobacteriota bacterium]GIU81731.1 MAG: O-acetyl-ADP-ribose deacetylase [Pyrinomonadaceae bacterium]
MVTLASYLNGKIVVSVGDITKEETDAIVNAANSSLLGGGGVDGAIHRAGGPEILQECKKIRQTLYPDGLPTGKAVITTGGKLKAKYVIHTVGPIYGQNQGKDAELLADCYINSLKLAVEKGIKSIAFPSISTGAFGYPKDEAAAVSSQAIENFLSSQESKTLNLIKLVFFSEQDAKIFIENQKFTAVPKSTEG